MKLIDIYRNISNLLHRIISVNDARAFDHARLKRLNAADDTLQEEGVICTKDIDTGYQNQHLSRGSFYFVYPYEPHFEICGFPYLVENGYVLHRLKCNKNYPAVITANLSNTAGGRVRFRTDSDTLSLKIHYDGYYLTPWLHLFGSAGLDVFIGNGNSKRFIATVAPEDPCSWHAGKEVLLTTKKREMIDVEIVLPSCASVRSLIIGIKKDSRLSVPTPYPVNRPIVFYGSSITQGLAASHPSNSFPYLIANHFNADFLNLGFSSGARGERSIAEDIAEINMSAFVMELDHNTETSNELRSAHFPFYKTIRDAHPEIPVIMLSRISGGLSIDLNETRERIGIIRKTLDKGLSQGDDKLWFINGEELMAVLDKEQYLTDGVHPNDRGMGLIAGAVIEILKNYYG